MSGQPKGPRGFGHVEAWVFDLDNTLYPADCNLFAQIDRRMGEFIAQQLGLTLDEAQALRQTYYYEHGTTLAGLVRLHGISPDAFLDYVHDIDLSAIAASPELAAAIDSLPGRKFVFTNGSRKHAEAVAARLGVLGRFEDIFDIRALEYIHPKPSQEAYQRFAQACGVAPAEAAMFDDLPHNLKTAHELGMTTVLVHGLTEHPEHQAIASWTELPAHIHHRTDALAPFLARIAAARVNTARTVRTPREDDRRARFACATACSPLPLCGGGIGRGVANDSPLTPSIRAFRTNVLPHKGGAGSLLRFSATTFRIEFAEP